MQGSIDRRGFLLGGVTLAAALASSRGARAQGGSALAVKSVERLAGSATSYAYAVKARP